MWQPYQSGTCQSSSVSPSLPLPSLPIAVGQNAGSLAVYGTRGWNFKFMHFTTTSNPTPLPIPSPSTRTSPRSLSLLHHRRNLFLCRGSNQPPLRSSFLFGAETFLFLPSCLSACLTQGVFLAARWRPSVRASLSILPTLPYHRPTMQPFVPRMSYPKLLLIMVSTKSDNPRLVPGPQMYVPQDLGV